MMAHELDALRYAVGRYISALLTPITADYEILDPEKPEPKALPKPKGNPC